MTQSELTALEAQLAVMDDKAVVAFFQSLEVDDERVDLVDGEIERRGLDV